MKMLKIEHLTKEYGEKKAVDDCAGSSICILGHMCRDAAPTRDRRRFGSMRICLRLPQILRSRSLRIRMV